MTAHKSTAHTVVIARWRFEPTTLSTFDTAEAAISAMDAWYAEDRQSGGPKTSSDHYCVVPAALALGGSAEVRAAAIASTIGRA